MKIVFSGTKTCILGCDAQIYSQPSGSINLKGYTDFYSCRWEIMGTHGSKIKVNKKTLKAVNT